MDTNRVIRTPTITRRDIVLIHRLLTILSRGTNADGAPISYTQDPEVTSSYTGNKRVSAGAPMAGVVMGAEVGAGLAPHMRM